MGINKVLIDTNVCIDAGQKRKPFAATALEILSLSERGIFEGMVAAHSFDTIFYFLLRKYSTTGAYKVINGLRGTVQVAPVNQLIIDAALNSNWNDFEDAIHYHVAMAASCDAIITRNKNDFISSKLPIYSPVDFLDELKGE